MIKSLHLETFSQTIKYTGEMLVILNLLRIFSSVIFEFIRKISTFYVPSGNRFICWGLSGTILTISLLTAMKTNITLNGLTKHTCLYT